MTKINFKQFKTFTDITRENTAIVDVRKPSPMFIDSLEENLKEI